MSDPRFRLATPADGPKCNDFHNRVYGKTRPLDGWAWEFCKDRDAEGPLPFVLIEQDGQVLGTQAYIPIEFIDQDGVFPTGKSEETLVDASLRGQGMFPKLYEHLFQVCEARQVHGLWGFTPAGKAFRKVGFETPSKVSQLLKPLKSDFVARALAASSETEPAPSLKNRLLGLAALAASKARVPGTADSQITIEPLTKAPEWAGDLSRRFVAAWGGTTLHRSKAYLQWRFLANPYAECALWGVYDGGAPVGLFASSLHGKLVYLVDVIIAPSPSDTGDTGDSARTERALDAMFHKLEALGKQAGASGIRGWHGSDHPFSAKVAARAKAAGWFHFKKGHEIVLWRNGALGANRLPANTGEIYITRAFTEGHLG
ncbi:MAG: GNAT family N-acetyltransferase [Alphaproteobacteria bacterium]|nr:GNAT family N-acetyltransferase [Alphaproteobacteria bacterium]